MARTKSKTSASTAAARARTGPSAAGAPAKVTLWVYKKGVEAVGGRMGFVQTTSDVAETLISAGQAVHANGINRYPFREGMGGSPAPAPAPAPPAPAPAPVPGEGGDAESDGGDAEARAE